MEFVTISMFSDDTEAHIVKGRLEADGIEVFLFGENSEGLMPMLGAYENGIKLCVREDDAERAKQIVAELGD